MDSPTQLWSSCVNEPGAPGGEGIIVHWIYTLNKLGGHNVQVFDRRNCFHWHVMMMMMGLLCHSNVIRSLL
jgi:hypothetical protein